MRHITSLILRAVFAVVLLAAPADAQELTAAIDIGGGARLSDGCPDHIWIPLNITAGQNPDSFGFSILVSDQDGVAVQGVGVTRINLVPIPIEGGHAHGPSTTTYGSISPSTTVYTNSNGVASFTLLPKNVGGLVYGKFSLEYNGQEQVVQTCNAFRYSMDDDYPSMGDGSDYALIGSTTTHPDNHRGQGPFLDGLATLALAYNTETTDKILAYNDISLVMGGLFDVNANWQSPHTYHHIGQNCDVRANGGLNSIPEDATLRAWFVQKARDIFGFTPLHEADGTSNEHYHICGVAGTACGS